MIRVRARPGASRWSASPVTTTIIVITVAVYLLGRVNVDLEIRLDDMFAQANFLVAEGQWWRLVTVVLLHGSPMHLFFNMWALRQLGPSVEAGAGRLSFLMLYLGAAAGGGLLAYRFGSFEDVAVGSSGAIFGLFGIWLGNAFRRRDSAFGRAMLSQLGFLLLINAALPFLVRNISWQGHLGGLITGLGIGELWARLQGGNLGAKRALVAGLVGLVALAVASL
jgi:membrane associated rhomboid family serine protease